jgi:hypothetical protein
MKQFDEIIPLRTQPSDRSTPLTEDNSTGLIMVGCIALCGYFTLVVLPIFLDIIFGFSSLIQCKFYEQPFLDIFTWMAINGIFTLLSFTCMIIRKKLLISYDFFWYKIFYLIDVVLNIFILIWTAIGTASFFMYYNINDNAYILVRMIVAPVVCMIRLVDLYNT